MKNVLITFGLFALLVSSAFAQTKAATDMSVFGLKLGEPFTVPECERLDLKIKNLERIHYKYSESVCFEQIPYSKDNGTAVNRWVKFPYKEAPQIVSTNTVSVLVMDGNLEGIGFNTLGTSADTMVFWKS